MISTILRRRAGVLAVAALAAVLPLSACGSGPTTTARAPAATPTIPARSSVDADAVWSVLRTLPASEVATLHAGFTAELRDELASIVHAAAESAR
jgi:hypothetical protein